MADVLALAAANRARVARRDFKIIRSLSEGYIDRWRMEKKLK